MPESGLHLVVGLGNPGSAYRNTRHNAGFMVVDEISDFFSIRLAPKRSLPGIIFGRGAIKDMPVIVAKPNLFMNNSGPPTVRLTRAFNISSRDMLVVHDDIDLAFGRLKIKEKGGHGGHKGLKSMIEAFSGGDFPRLRVGIGRGQEAAATGPDVTDHVLGRFSDAEHPVLNRILSQARDAVTAILCEGIAKGMNRFNNPKTMMQI